MRFSSSLVAAAGLLSTANAAIKGFNYGANFGNDQAKTVVDFEYEFNAAKNLPGTNGWTSARLYTMIQHGTTNTPIEAIQAAINTQTTLLLGMWASAGQANFDNEIAALKSAIAQYGTAFTDLVEGISVGSEDLYRITPTGIENNSGAGAQPQELINYVQQTRSTIAGTSLAGKPIGHVDTWTVYVNATNNDFISSLDFVGMDAYPYFQTTMANSVGSGSQLFFDAYHATVGAAQGKPVWVTETGWPVSGETLNQAVPSADNARIYWEDVTCQLVADNVNLYYYILQDVQYGNPVPSFGIKPGGDLQAVNPLFDLSCPASSKPQSNPTQIVGNGYTAQLSPTISTVFVFDVRPGHQGKTCNLVFFLPPAFPFPDMSPVKIRSPGGITVSRLSNSAARPDVTANDVGTSTPVGAALSMQFANQYIVGSGPCDAGQQVAYQVDSTGGLAMNFFQMISPPLGLFMIPL
ncbi:glycoside hydrolase [Setomelanomma holmii]|uniref:Probable glucan endo-1,3-beta-glucosidase eglC n=1 Tax=Setomelanomma holmii TaxID=210430 RepID=A0A9P4H806_9PLEO|nr:glycoside hydrolase [Setomelanomma holmii]